MYNKEVCLSLGNKNIRLCSSYTDLKGYFNVQCKIEANTEVASYAHSFSLHLNERGSAEKSFIF